MIVTSPILTLPCSWLSSKFQRYNSCLLRELLLWHSLSQDVGQCFACQAILEIDSFSVYLISNKVMSDVNMFSPPVKLGVLGHHNGRLVVFHADGRTIWGVFPVQRLVFSSRHTLVSAALNKAIYSALAVSATVSCFFLPDVAWSWLPVILVTCSVSISVFQHFFVSTVDHSKVWCLEDTVASFAAIQYILLGLLLYLANIAMSGLVHMAMYIHQTAYEQLLIWLLVHCFLILGCFHETISWIHWCLDRFTPILARSSLGKLGWPIQVTLYLLVLNDGNSQEIAESLMSNLDDSSSLALFILALSFPAKIMSLTYTPM